MRFLIEPVYCITWIWTLHRAHNKSKCPIEEDNIWASCKVTEADSAQMRSKTVCIIKSAKPPKPKIIKGSYHMKNDLVKKLQSVQLSKSETLVSFESLSLFANTPVDKATEIVYF